MAALPAPGEAVWLPKGGHHTMRRTPAAAAPPCHRRAGFGFHLTASAVSSATRRFRHAGYREKPDAKKTRSSPWLLAHWHGSQTIDIRCGSDPSDLEYTLFYVPDTFLVARHLRDDEVRKNWRELRARGRGRQTVQLLYTRRDRTWDSQWNTELCGEP